MAVTERFAHVVATWYILYNFSYEKLTFEAKCSPVWVRTTSFHPVRILSKTRLAGRMRTTEVFIHCPPFNGIEDIVSNLFCHIVRLHVKQLFMMRRRAHQR